MTLRIKFQCHHGVLASAMPSGSSRRPATVSMPPRRSCFAIREGRILDE